MSMHFGAAILLVGVILVSGCTSEPVYSNDPAYTTTEILEETETASPGNALATLGEVYATTKNWDSDASDDGLEFYLQPKDSKGGLVKASGTISATLWEVVNVDEYGLETGKGDIVKQWSEIGVRQSDYDYAGVRVRLQFDDDYVPDKYATGILLVELESNGESFSTETKVLLGY